MLALRAAGDLETPRCNGALEGPLLDLLVERADDQPVAVAEQMGDEIAPPRRRDVVQSGANEGETLRRIPAERVPDVDAIRPLRQTPPREHGELGRDLQPVRLHAMLGPADDALHQEAARAADVEERTVPVDCIGDVAPCLLPQRFVAGLAGLSPRRLGCEVRRDDEVGHRPVPALLVDLAALEGGV